MTMSSARPIWKLVEECATELTKGGLTPFTRGDLITCVQRKRSGCSPDSVNPIIQGMTDNLRGGAPGSVGKNILHSVGRGLFILRSGPTDSSVAKPKLREKAQAPQNPAIYKSSKSISLGNYDFNLVTELEPERSDQESITKFLPQDRFKNDGSIPLNRYGKGPFCKFKIPRDIQVSGVYAIKVSDEVRYVGECQALSDRFNMGYGNISPRNCFAGGQQTNCRINNLIYQEAQAGLRITLWFHATEDYKTIERELLDANNFNWNRS
jgi:hypothetical protein